MLRSIFGHIDFLGKGATTPLEDVSVSSRGQSQSIAHMRSTNPQTEYVVRIQRDFSDMNFFFFSDVWLDQADTLRGLQKIFDNCIENNFVPKVIVFCGNFTSSGIAQGNSRDIQKYQGKWFPPPPPPLRSLSTIAHTPILFCFHSRGFRFPSRLDRSLHPHNAPHALRLRTRSTRLDRQLGPTPQTPPRLVHRPAAVQDPQRPPGEQPVPSEVLRAGDRRLSRRRHVAHAPELGRRQVRRAERRSEALCMSRCMSMCTPSLFNLADAHVRSRHTARPVYTRSEPPRPIHDAHATDPSRIRPRDASLSFTHMRAYNTTALLDFFCLTLS